jgi:hypothetical protein
MYRTRLGAKLLDPFGGTGLVGLAAYRCHRKCMVIEKFSDTKEPGIKRWERYYRWCNTKLPAAWPVYPTGKEVLNPYGWCGDMSCRADGVPKDNRQWGQSDCIYTNAEALGLKIQKCEDYDDVGYELVNDRKEDIDEGDIIGYFTGKYYMAKHQQQSHYNIRCVTEEDVPCYLVPDRSCPVGAANDGIFGRMGKDLMQRGEGPNAEIHLDPDQDLMSAYKVDFVMLSPARLIYVSTLVRWHW